MCRYTYNIIMVFVEKQTNKKNNTKYDSLYALRLMNINDFGLFFFLCKYI